MRGEGWQSSKMAMQRRSLDRKLKLSGKLRTERAVIEKILDLNGQWWCENGLISSAESSEDEDDTVEDSIYVSSNRLLKAIALFSKYTDSSS